MKNKKKTLQTQRTSSRHGTLVLPSGALRGDAKNGAPTPDSRPPNVSCNRMGRNRRLQADHAALATRPFALSQKYR